MKTPKLPELGISPTRAERDLHAKTRLIAEAMKSEARANMLEEWAEHGGNHSTDDLPADLAEMLIRSRNTYGVDYAESLARTTAKGLRKDAAARRKKAEGGAA